MAAERFAGLFISHGAPTLPLDDHPARDFLRELGARLARPRAIVALSPHWLRPELSIKSPAQYETWHDFQGFPDALYRLQYRPPGDAAVREATVKHLHAADIAVETVGNDRRLDHGVWVPLMLMFPRADVPVVQLSATWDTPQRYREIGRALRPLTEDGVLVLGSGGAVHNLRELEFDDASEAPAWSREFDDWVAQRVERGDWSALCDYRREAPGADRAHPTEDHFLPLFFAGAVGDRATPLHRSFSYGSLSMAAYGFS